MRIVSGIVLTLAFSALLWGQDPAVGAGPSDAAAPQVKGAASDQAQATGATGPPKPAGTVVPPPPSPQAVAEAKKQFKAGVKLKSSGKTEAAFEKFEQASKLDPRNVEYITAREFARQQVGRAHV